ncbi:beta-glucosidase BglX [Saccharicrinis sp. FJH54]|uniref:beta-glucosidase BglX n=1 Tax=Saccharicrinis sp. FJH54 TaxID=3344665 RepID=UPI0035D44FE5
MKTTSILTFLLVSVIAFLAGCADKKQGYSTEPEINEQVEALLAKMTLEEKVGQMNQYNGFYDATGPAPSEGDAKNKLDHLKKGWVGSVLNVRGAEATRELQRIVVEESRLGIPLIFGLDVIHGHKTLTPIPLAEAASWDLAAIEKSARNAAIEATAVGQNWTFAPMVDISRDARWGRVMEGAGEDPYLGSLIGAARVRGFQGDDLAANNTMAACAKHFAGYGFSESGRDYNTVDVGTSTLYNIILPPFKAVVDADVKTVMNSFNTLNGIPATGNAFLQRDILKGAWGFKGFVISDWGSGQQMIPHGYASDLEQVAEMAANAGSDMDMESYSYVKYLVKLVESGKVKEAVVDDAVRRILTVKYELGLFDDPYKYCSEEREKDLLYHPDHQKDALDIARKSIVLLKNEGHILPLDRNKKVVVIGALAEDKTSPLGSWRIGSDDSTAVSVLEGLDLFGAKYAYAEGAKLVTGPVAFNSELVFNTTDRSGFSKAVALAKSAGTVVMVLGEHGLQTGEGRSRTELGLPGLQQELLENVYAVNKNIVLVLMNGRPLTLTWADEHIPAILETWHLGSQSGNAIAQTLYGANNPSGKLPMSFPRRVGQCPIYYNHLNTGRPGPNTDVFWSHYMDVANTPLYPFGYGLSYSGFDYSGLQVDASDPKAVKVSVTVKNTSDRDGEEVTQLYIRDRFASVARPVKELKGFEKYMLKAGESKTISFILTAKELGFYDNDGRFVVEPGMFDVMVGTSSDKGLTGEFELM